MMYQHLELLLFLINWQLIQMQIKGIIFDVFKLHLKSMKEGRSERIVVDLSVQQDGQTHLDAFSVCLDGLLA